MPAPQDIMQIVQSASRAYTYRYRRGPGGLTPDFLTLVVYFRRRYCLAPCGDHGTHAARPPTF